MSELKQNIYLSDVTLAELRSQGWAQGNYLNTCAQCEETHLGSDKRAVRCLQCAAKEALAARSASEDTQPKATTTENEDE